MINNKFSIVLVAPEIPGNTGSIGRTCVALNIPLILIRPYGFELNEKALRRAGLDYWKHLRLFEYDSWLDFTKAHSQAEKYLFFENQAQQSYFQAPYAHDCYLIFGSETQGLPIEILDNYHQQYYSLPQYSPHIRSLNLANAATAAAYECLRQLL